MSSESVFLPRDGRFVATELARGPWDASAQHGGAPAALLMRAFEGLPGGLQIARVTYELLRPVPLGELLVEAEVVRPGRRVALLEARLRDADRTELVRARALRVNQTEAPAVEEPPPSLPGPADGIADRPRTPLGEAVSFGTDAMEIRFVAGRFNERGPATAWFRLRVPIVAGEQPTPLQLLAAAADFGNGISAALPWGDYVFINPDLTLYVERPPEGEWVALASQTHIPANGVGLSESVLYDARGRVGRAVQALLIARR
jgi:hypothetical protein